MHSSLIEKIEKLVATLATLLLVAVHVSMLVHTGALWRDEVNSLNVATLKSWCNVWQMNEYDSYPLLWHMVLRTWTFVGFGETDMGLRILGLIVGLGIIGALWWNAQNFGYGFPLVSILLFASNPTTIRIGNSLRAYGCGALLMLLLLGMIWKVVLNPTMKTCVIAATIALLAVQCLYYNSVLLLAISLGGLAVCYRNRSWKAAGVLITIGLVCAFSMLPYLDPISRAGKWHAMVKFPINFPWIAYRFNEAIATSGKPMTWVWLGLLLVALLYCYDRVVKSGFEKHDHDYDLALFVGVTLGTAIVGYFVFLRMVSFFTQSWYYLLIMGLLAVLIDAAISMLVRNNNGLRGIRLVLFVFVLVMISGNVVRASKVRQTNVDLVAQKLLETSTESDLIIIHPWWPGLTFERYYQGLTPWMTLPDISEHRIQRYDLVMEKMKEDHPNEDILEKARNTLQLGHTIWFVCDVSLLQQTGPPRYLPPAPNGPLGWHEGPYLLYWMRQVAYFMKSHAQTIEEIAVSAGTSVNEHENMRLYRVRVWRE